jgi:hypothetical protein
MWEYAIGFVVGYIVCLLQVHRAITRAVDEVIEEHTNTAQTAKQIRARVEECDGVFLLYNNDTNEFIAQGIDHATLKDNVRARWSEFDVLIVAGDADHIKLLKEQYNASSNNK